MNLDMEEQKVVHMEKNTMLNLVCKVMESKKLLYSQVWYSFELGAETVK